MVSGRESSPQFVRDARRLAADGKRFRTKRARQIAAMRAASGTPATVDPIANPLDGVSPAARRAAVEEELQNHAGRVRGRLTQNAAAWDIFGNELAAKMGLRAVVQRYGEEVGERLRGKRAQDGAEQAQHHHDPSPHQALAAFLTGACLEDLPNDQASNNL